MSAHSVIDPNLLAKIKKLSIQERILIVEDIWDSIALSNEDLKVTAKQKENLNRRFKDYKNDPTDGSSWPGVKNRIESRL